MRPAGDGLMVSHQTNKTSKQTKTSFTMRTIITWNNQYLVGYYLVSKKKMCSHICAPQYEESKTAIRIAETQTIWKIQTKKLEIFQFLKEKKWKNKKGWSFLNKIWYLSMSLNMEKLQLQSELISTKAFSS